MTRSHTGPESCVLPERCPEGDAGLQRCQQLHSAAAELERRTAELKGFSYAISHDMRAPLLNVKGFAAELSGALDELNGLFREAAERLDEGPRLRIAQLFEQEVPEALDFINSSVQRMDRQIGAVLKLSRLGHRELKAEPVVLRGLVQTILKSMSHQLEARHCTVLVGELPELVSDRVALEQILGNLLDNAVKYLDPARPGCIEVSGERGSGEVVLRVRDNGRGIAQKDQGSIFEIFRRAGRQDVPGEGMGLAYVQTLVGTLRGQISCQSEPGCGSCFSFSLPQGD